MKPHRIRMTNDLIVNYGLYQHLQVYVRMDCPLAFPFILIFYLYLNFSTFPFSQRPPRASAEDMSRFHADDYVDFLRRVTPDGMTESNHKLAQKCKKPKPEHSKIYSFFPLQSTSEKIVQFTVDCMSFAKFQLVAPLLVPSNSTTAKVTLPSTGPVVCITPSVVKRLDFVMSMILSWEFWSC